ncbi:MULTISPECIES: hypothetical protein [Vibrio]|uniref:Uncharacterized protein n=1 Tax=Vibrio algicola TaxID=2662262 RepID=A0A5Q0TGT0_9VIBR|nr:MULTISPECIES: hypothetical protein [Vibrio]MBD1577380.1 hypothetical protein [Vibrio sp. S11_S32]
MKKLVQKVLVVNVGALLVVSFLSKVVPVLQPHNMAEFLFFVLLAIWIVAAVAWQGSKQSVSWDQISVCKPKENNFGMLMTIAGIPALIGCLVL